MARTENSLPNWALRVLERLVPYRNRDVVVGDFAEVFHFLAMEEGRFAAVRWYAWQLVRSLPSFFLGGVSTGGSMLSNYIKVAARNLSKRKFYAALNIGGLAIGMAVCLLILQYVAFETSYDSFHDEAERLYRVNLETFHAGESRGMDGLTYYGVGDLIAGTVPEIEAVTRVHPQFGSGLIRVLESGSTPVAYREQNIGFVEPSYFAFFDFPARAGTPSEAIARRGTVVLTESVAEKYFGEADPIGRVLDVRSWIDGEFEVAAVIADMPANSHLKFDVLLPFEDLVHTEQGQYAETEGWSWSNFTTYVRLAGDAPPGAVAAKIADAVNAYRAEAWAPRGRTVGVELQPVTRIHLYTDFDDYFAGSSAYKTVFFLSAIGVMVLIIAWMNYVNLTTARAIERSLEVGIRKASGARRGQVIGQFLVESLLVNGIALILGALISLALLPRMNELVGVSIPADIWKSHWVWLGLFGLFGIGALAASVYPSLFLSRYRPAAVLRGGPASDSAGVRLRKALVVLQFALSISLLSGVYIVYKQVGHLRNLDLGFSLDQTLVVRRPAVIDDPDAFPASSNAFTTAIENLAGVRGVATSTSVPGGGFNLGTSFRRESDAASDAINVNVSWVDYDFLDVYGFELAAGRNFSRDIPSDPESAVLINEAGVRMVGYDSIEEALDGNLIFGGSNPATIVGVLRDFDWMSAKEAQSPVILSLSEEGANYSVKLSSSDVQETVLLIESLFTRHFPGNPFEYFFADRNFNELFEAEERLQTLVGVFAGFALLVASLGLIGLAALTTSRRVKEISIRKVLGASDRTIARLLTGHFVVLVLFGVVLSVPAVYVVSSNWLSGFASRVALSPDVFLLPGLAVLATALIASMYHVVRASRANPVDGIRSQ